MFVAFAVFVPEIFTGAEVDPADVGQAIGLIAAECLGGQPADRGSGGYIAANC